MRNLIVGALLLALVASPAAAQTQTAVSPVGEAGAAVWREDLKYLSAELARRHRNAFHAISRERFEKEVRDLDARIPSLARHQIVAELARMVAIIGDGHTVMRGFPFGPNSNFRFYPVGLYYFDDGLFVHSADPKYADAVGGRVVSIGGTPIDVALQRISPYIARDNEMGIKLYAPVLFTSPEVLQAAGVVKDMERIALAVDKGGRAVTVMLEPTSPPDFMAHRELFDNGFIRLPGWADAREKGTTPLLAKSPRDFYWFEYLPDRRALYVQYNEVANKEGETVEAFAVRLHDYIAANPVERLIIDVRRNGGGNNGLNKPLLLAILRSTTIDQPGRLFVITGRETFSAAQNFVNLFDKFANVTFVGEPTGGSPNHYGDARPITLPNSKLVAQASTLWWQDMDPRDNRPWTGPHVAAEMRFDDYRTNRDVALEAALAYAPQPPIAPRVREAVDAKNPARAGEILRAYVADPSHRYTSAEAAINTLGYQLFGEKRVTDAITVFKLNTEVYPDSFNVWDSLAEGYAEAGDRENAIKYYEKTLQMNPDNPGARTILERLRTGGQR